MTEHRVTLADVLAAKEARQQRQVEVRTRCKTTLVSITVNMPGSVKDRLVLRRLRDYAVEEMKRRFAVVEEIRINQVTGPEALLAVKGEACEVKAAAVVVEEADLFGRLLDIDVFSAAGEQLSRQQQGGKRLCLVCGQAALQCMRERKHSPKKLEAGVAKLVHAFLAYETRAISPVAQAIGAAAAESMLYEASCTPAPGLVDRDNSGAHKDMDFFTFMASSAALAFTMARLAQAGINHEGPLTALLPVLRHIGRDGEMAMFKATGGVNTQKGLLFSLGIVVAAAGIASRCDQRFDAAKVLDITAGIVEGIIATELGQASSKPGAVLTAGERLYLDYGITGIRGEMANGMPAVRQYALPTLREAWRAGMSVNDALVQTLLVLMAHIDDTTVMNRHNPDKMRYWVREQVTKILCAGGISSPGGRQMVAELDEVFIRHNVSPGGAADLLAVTWFLHKIETDL